MSGYDSSVAGVVETVVSIEQVNMTIDGVSNQSRELETQANILDAVIQNVKV